MFLPFLVGFVLYALLQVELVIAVIVGILSVVPFMKPLATPESPDQVGPAIDVPIERPMPLVLDAAAITASSAVIGIVGQIAVQAGAEWQPGIIGARTPVRPSVLDSVTQHVAGLAATYGTDVGPITVLITTAEAPDGRPQVNCVAYEGSSPDGQVVRTWTITGLPDSYFREL